VKNGAHAAVAGRAGRGHTGGGWAGCGSGPNSAVPTWRPARDTLAANATRCHRPAATAASEFAHRPLTTADVIATSAPADWRPLDPQNTLYLELPTGRVIIELNTEFAPHHAANIEALAREGYYNGTSIVRSPGQLRGPMGGSGRQASNQKRPEDIGCEFERTARGVLLRRWWIPTLPPEVWILRRVSYSARPKFGVHGSFMLWQWSVPS